MHRCIKVGVVVVGLPPMEESASRRFFHDAVVVVVILPSALVTLEELGLPVGTPRPVGCCCGLVVQQ